jgi:hypothetical protein
MPSSYGEQMGMKGRLRPMKNPFRLLTAVLLLATASQAWAADQYLKVSVTGTVQTQLLLGPGVGRIYTAPLNKKRIFQEFGVSAADYELVINLSGIGLLLLPKNAAANLPEITVLAPTFPNQALVDTRAHVEKIRADIGASTATNLFKDLFGQLEITYFFQGPVASPKVNKVVVNVKACGTDPAGGNTSSAFLNFKATAQGIFVPQ